VTQTNSFLDRRRFLTGAAAAGAVLVRPEAVRGSSANSALRMGIIGCGGRGRAVTTAFIENTNVRMVALADLFTDQLENAQRYYNGLAARKGYAGIDPKLMFRGPRAFEQLANSKDVDVVVISSPDYFHPEHLKCVVEAGKHVYCEKPAAVDVAGCQRFVEIGQQAQGRLSLEVGFQVRCAPPFSEMVGRIHAGAIGKVACASSYYHATELNYPPRPNASPLEARIRNFYWDRVLSGDVIVDQNIHVVDICNWVMNAHPVKAVGTGGRSVRQDPGNIWDHWAVTFFYPNDVVVSFNSVQFGKKFWDVGVRFFGDKGVAESYYSGAARVVGDQSWDFRSEQAKSGNQAFSATGDFDGLASAEAVKTKAFVDSITRGEFHNQAATGAESALSAILGRMAAYSGREVTWEEMIRSSQSYEGAVDLSKL
jgi:myo-inositol 2-dehydrogenase / D-chiro-inositol 1-dehydrogenase